jgi:hypothetical protein
VPFITSHTIATFLPLSLSAALSPLLPITGLHSHSTLSLPLPYSLRLLSCPHSLKTLSSLARIGQRQRPFDIHTHTHIHIHT